MHLEVVDNGSQKLFSVLSPVIQRCQEVKIAVAFVSKRGLSLIEPSIRCSLRAGAFAEFLVGLDLSTTEPEALWSLHRLAQREANVHLYCYADLGPSVIYHPKLYVMNIGEETVAVVGSSNLTVGGLKRNVEVNAVITAATHEEVISDIYATYNRLKFDPRRVEPDDRFLALYEDLCHRQKRQERSAGRDKSFHHMMTEFREKAETLRRPQPTSRDLFGWLGLVYNLLPSGAFSNSQIYAFEDEFRRSYPENRNIKAKIRQQLQELRDMGLVKPLGAGHWQKT